ncbi:hypothetical protein EOD39_6073 [Acipenser ruthenus]|uniref:Uncharacterized protein n=1 Tax=Acipenser ruthenus TaxID=7906 RepID=A0A444UBU6_ACIRT|nr:hypothetical protein EOD39_6073 [Acipenser ruthenus]
MIAKEKLLFCPPEIDVSVGRKLRNQVSRLSSGAEAEPCYPELRVAGLIRTMQEDWIETGLRNCVFQKRWVKFDGENLSYYNNDKVVR